MSFYVTLPSHANRREFPNNQANSFKIRLPQPLQLTGGGWQVGLSAISLPDARVNLYELVMKGQHVLGIKWHLKAPSQSGGTYNKYGAAVTKIDDINDWDWVVDGVSFLGYPDVCGPASIRRPLESPRRILWRAYQCRQAVPPCHPHSKDPLHRCHLLVPMGQQNLCLPEGASSFHLHPGSHRHPSVLWSHPMSNLTSA